MPQATLHAAPAHAGTGVPTTLPPLPALDASGLSAAQRKLPNAARMYDYLLGGHHNLAIDRVAAEAAIAIYPGFPLVMQANRAFARRAVQFLVGQGVTRFLDVGSGIPTVGNVHEVAQRVNCAARVVYVDIDQVTVAHSTALLRDNPRATVIQGDLRTPEQILDHPAVRDLLNPVAGADAGGGGGPVALLLGFVLHFVVDDARALSSVQVLRDALPSGSFVAISHGTVEQLPAETLKQLVGLYTGTSQPVKPRSRAEIEAFFQGLELVEPGLVFVPQWRPDEQGDLLLDQPERSIGFAGIGKKP